MLCTVILSPELSVNPCFMHLWLDQQFLKRIDRVCMDEAHCISQWGREFCSSYLCLGHLYNVLGSSVPFFLTSATLCHKVLQDVINLVGLPQNIEIHQRSNDRPNIHFCVRPMKHSIKSYFDLAFLVPLGAHVDDLQWVEENVQQFLLYWNSHADTIQSARFLCSCLPCSERHRVVWYHSGMSDHFKKDVEVGFKAGCIWGICCTDACGMVGHFVVLLKINNTHTR